MTMGIEKTKKSQNIEKGKEKRHVRYVKNEQTHEGRWTESSVDEMLHRFIHPWEDSELMR